MIGLLKEDPFLRFSLFPNSDNLYLLHGHEIIGSLVFYQVVYAYVAPWFNRLVFRERYRSIRDAKTRIDFDIHTVSSVQCLVTFYTIAPTLFLPMDLNVVTYRNELVCLASALAVGYFLWDLLVCVRHFNLYGFEFLAHAASSLYVFMLSLKPFCQAWVPKFLLFEASTPFVNNNWFIAQLSRGASKPVVPMWVNALNGLLLLVTFFSVRILWGFVGVSILAFQMWKVRTALPVIQSAILCALNMILNTLNLFWFYKMLKLAKKMANGSSRAAKSM
ncbi:hypothetical protein HG536_0F00760 [Torulaspora globosa]|uniref:TLC domain-containing protein n=1 Tax=Torulaspora globosa TaxID=48254 RepID=A0A7G3ZJR5_9SACH|nr:uncharacterized protein HG536_0F00760 [Torulaspora globosa]QLL33751.1 hypothetical protein HG536_0F00760 [Torulaspora globosa]